MKLVMYHYVKKEKKEYPFLNSLSFRKFQNQIKFFEKNGGISDNINYQHSKKDSFILTFDDGLKDHLMVAEYLNKRGLKGFFFISCYPLIYKKILPVHQMHIILSKINLDIVHKKFFGLCTSFNEKNIYKFLKNKENNKYYKPLDDDNKKKEIKKIFNYYLSRNQRLKILKSLNKYFDINVDSQNYYLNKNEIKYMKNLGMEIGSHGINHEPLNKLSYFEQKKEIIYSKLYIEKFLKSSIKYFCFPYGWKYSYNLNSLKILKKSNYDFAFAVNKRALKKRDLIDKFELPRYDTNDFPS